ncbi:MAG: spermine synthase, partial [Mariprofundus sp.]|nr:spermine synthase [Mariprofundus sp.]
AVSAAILITFLLGIGIGSRYAWRLWAWLWLIELLIGLCGAAFVFASGALDALLYSSLPLLPAGLTGSIIACMLLLVTPAFLIGCSVPLFAGYMRRLSPDAQFSTVYAIYNIGAALTALLIEYVLLRSFGIRGTVLCFVGLNVLLAILLRFGFKLPQPRQSSAPESNASLAGMRYRWLALVPVSMASAVFQLLMVKLAEMLLGPFRESFAPVLSIVLLGIALGAMLVRRFHISFQTTVLLSLIGVVLFFIDMEPVAYLYAGLYEQASDYYATAVLLKWGCLLLLMGLPSLAFGATIPALLGNKTDASEDIGRESGQLLFVASMANVAGFLLMVFVLHRYLDYGVVLLVIALLAALSLLLHMGRQRISVLAAGLLLLGSGIAYAVNWDEELLYISYTNFRDIDDLNEARDESVASQRYKGYQDVFAINRVNGSPYFFINGYNSIPLNNPSERIVGAVSSYFAPETAHALVLGLGSGATASVVGQLFDHTDVIEINPVVRRNLFRMKQWNFDIESNSKVNIIVDDAIHYVRASHQQYDLILNTVTTPLYFSSSKLYTTDFFGVVKARLKPGGVYVTWMDARIGDKGADIILNTVKSSFRYCALLYIKSSYFLLICSDEPVRARALAQFKAGHQVYDNLLGEGIIPEWLKYQLLSDDVLPLVDDTNQRLNTSDYPALEFEMARLSGRGIAGFKQRLSRSMDLKQLRGALGQLTQTYPAELVWHTELRLGNAMFTHRWKELAKEYDADFDASYHAVEQRYMQRFFASSNADALHYLGYRLMKSHQYQAALSAFRHVLELDASHNNSHFNMAACYERIGDFNNALKHYRWEERIDPDDEDVPYRIGRVYVLMKRFDEAVRRLREAERVMGKDIPWRVYDYLGKAYDGLGDAERAKAAYRQSKQLQAAE